MSRKSEEVKGAQCPTLFQSSDPAIPSQLLTLDMLREMQQDGHSTNARRVAPADLSTGTRPWHLAQPGLCPGFLSIAQCKSLRSMTPIFPPARNAI
jgi:hypothetical protein